MPLGCGYALGHPRHPRRKFEKNALLSARLTAGCRPQQLHSTSNTFAPRAPWARGYIASASAIALSAMTLAPGGHGVSAAPMYRALVPRCMRSVPGAVGNALEHGALVLRLGSTRLMWLRIAPRSLLCSCVCPAAWIRCVSVRGAAIFSTGISTRVCKCYCCNTMQVSTVPKGLR